MATEQTLAELRARYKELYGENASGRAREQFLIEKIKEKEAEIDTTEEDELSEEESEQEVGEQEATPEEQSKEVTPVNVVKSPKEEGFTHGGKFYPFMEGNRYNVIFKGRVRDFSASSIAIIQKDKALFSEFELPKGSPVTIQEKKRRA